MNGDNIMRLILVGLCTVGLGSLVIAGSVAYKELERQKKREHADDLLERRGR